MKNFFKRRKPWYKKKRNITLALLIAGVVALRIALPEIVKTEANKRLATFSPIIGGEIGDVDLSFLRGAYQTENVRVWLKENERTFLKVGQIDVSIAWGMLLRGRIMAEVALEHLEVDYSKHLLSELKKIPASVAKKQKKQAIPFDLERVEVVDSHVNFTDYPGLKKGESFVLSAINGRLSNLTPTKNDPYTLFDLRSDLQGLTLITARGKANIKSNPINWDMDSELHALDLTSLNEVLKESLPLTFKRGQLDFYAEAKSENGKIEGYVKPFFEDLKFVGNKSDFEGAKHWLIEIAGALGNFILRNDKVDSVATRIPFQFTNKLKIDSGEALEEAIQHGFEEHLKPGIENKLQIK